MTATDASDTPRVVRECTLDWSRVDSVISRDGSLDPTAKSLYMALTTYVDRRSRVSDTDPHGVDVPTRRALAECVGVDVRTIDRATRRLEEYRLPTGQPVLVVERRRDPHRPKSHLPSVYHLLDHEHWDARAAERHASREAARRGPTPRDTSVTRGGDTGVPRGGGGSDTGVARGSDTSVAVPIPTQKTTTGGGAGVSAIESRPGGGGAPQEDREALRAVIRREVYDAMTLAERDDLAAAVRGLTDAGWTLDQIRARRPDRRVDGRTTHPATHIAEALRTIAADTAPAAAAPSAARIDAGLIDARQDAAEVARDIAAPGSPQLMQLDLWIKRATKSQLEAWIASPTIDVVEGARAEAPRPSRARAAMAALAEGLSAA